MDRARRECRARQPGLQVTDDGQDEARRDQDRRVEAGAGAERLTRATVGGLVSATLGMILRVRRHGPGVDVHRERAHVAKNDEHCHANE